MKMICNVPDEAIKSVKDGTWCGSYMVEKIIATGIPLPKVHGRLIDADKCIRQAWDDFYKHEDEWEKKDPDYVGVKRFHDQNGFECCLKTIGESPTVIEADKAEKV